MTNISQFIRFATAAVGALVISTACVAAAVGPAASAGPSQSVAASQISFSAEANA